MDLKAKSDKFLFSQVFSYDNGMIPVGGLPLDFYLKELLRRNKHNEKLYHSDFTVIERYDKYFKMYNNYYTRCR